MEYFKEARPEDFEAYYGLKCQKDAILWSGFTTPPDKDKLRKHYIANIIDNPDTYLYFLWIDDEIVGSLQGSRIDDITVEIGASNVFKKHQGLGYIQDLSKLFIEKMKDLGYEEAVCWVSDKNKPSEYNNQFNKFTKTDEFEERNLPLLGGIHRFYKWQKSLK